MTNRAVYRWEAFKITLFCLLGTGLFVLVGVSEKTLLILFNIAVMSSAATFSPDKKQLAHYVEGFIVITASILTGGVLGFYFPIVIQIVAVLYATFAFLVPKTKFHSNVLVTGALMFWVFAAFPFNIESAMATGAYSLLLLVAYILFHALIGKYFILGKKTISMSPNIQGCQLAIVCFISMTLAVGLGIYLSNVKSLSHLYWISLTVLAVLQSSAQGAVKIALLRIAVNTFGAIIVVILMSAIMPPSFWVNFAFLTILLFLIFAFGYSYVKRTLCIELFVLSYTHLLGNYHNSVSFDRIVLTLIGGGLVIIAALLLNILQLDKKHSNLTSEM